MRVGHGRAEALDPVQRLLDDAAGALGHLRDERGRRLALPRRPLEGGHRRLPRRERLGGVAGEGLERAEPRLRVGPRLGEPVHVGDGALDALLELRALAAQLLEGQHHLPHRPARDGHVLGEAPDAAGDEQHRPGHRLDRRLHRRHGAVLVRRAGAHALADRARLAGAHRHALARPLHVDDERLEPLRHPAEVGGELADLVARDGGGAGGEIARGDPVGRPPEGAERDRDRARRDPGEDRGRDVDDERHRGERPPQLAAAPPQRLLGEVGRDEAPARCTRGDEPAVVEPDRPERRAVGAVERHVARAEARDDPAAGAEERGCRGGGEVHVLGQLRTGLSRGRRERALLRADRGRDVLAVDVRPVADVARRREQQHADRVETEADHQDLRAHGAADRDVEARAEPLDDARSRRRRERVGEHRGEDRRRDRDRSRGEREILGERAAAHREDHAAARRERGEPDERGRPHGQPMPGERGRRRGGLVHSRSVERVRRAPEPSRRGDEAEHDEDPLEREAGQGGGAEHLALGVGERERDLVRVPGDDGASDDDREDVREEPSEEAHRAEESIASAARKGAAGWRDVRCHATPRSAWGNRLAARFARAAERWKTPIDQGLRLKPPMGS